MVETSRAALERKIVEAKNRLNPSLEDLSWIGSTEAGEFLDRWLHLYVYYGTHEDIFEVHFEVLHTYFAVERILQKILRDPKHVKYFEAAAEMLDALEYSIDGIIKEGYRKLRPDIYASFKDEYLDEDERFENQDDLDERES